MSTAQSPVPVEPFTEERSTAVHEAGHGVMAYLLGRPFARITVVPEQDALGRVEHVPPSDWFRPDIEINSRVRTRVEANIMIGLAGAETEARWTRSTTEAPQDWEARQRIGATHDQTGAVHFALYMSSSEDEASAYLEWLRQRVLNSVGDDDQPGDARYWRLVIALADAAQRTGTCSWRRARSVLQQSDQRWIDAQRAQHPDLERQITALTDREAPMSASPDTSLDQPIVAAVVTSALGMLLTWRKDKTPPAGFLTGEIEPGESPTDAMVREVKEESGLQVTAEREIGRRVHPRTGRTIIYVSGYPTGGPDVFVGDEDELAVVRWVTLAEADKAFEPFGGMFEPVHAYLSSTLTG